MYLCKCHQHIRRLVLGLGQSGLRSYGGFYTDQKPVHIVKFLPVPATECRRCSCLSVTETESKMLANSSSTSSSSSQSISESGLERHSKHFVRSRTVWTCIILKTISMVKNSLYLHHTQNVRYGQEHCGPTSYSKRWVWSRTVWTYIILKMISMVKNQRGPTY